MDGLFCSNKYENINVLVQLQVLGWLTYIIFINLILDTIILSDLNALLRKILWLNAKRDFLKNSKSNSINTKGKDHLFSFKWGKNL